MIVAAKQNQKFPFHFFFRFAVEGWGEETRGKCKEIFWFLHTRVREHVRGAFSLNQDLTQNTFELCPINTAKIWLFCLDLLALREPERAF